MAGIEGGEMNVIQCVTKRYSINGEELERINPAWMNELDIVVWDMLKIQKKSYFPVGQTPPDDLQKVDRQSL
jgi:hypothetical protein